MATNKKPRKAYKPKRKVHNLLAFMAKIPEETIREDAICYEMAFKAILNGNGTIADCDIITNVMNATAVMCLQHDWPEHYDIAVLGQRAQQSMVNRVKAGKSILYTGQELSLVNDTIAIYSAQMELMTPRDIANASYLVSQTLVARNHTKPL